MKVRLSKSTVGAAEKESVIRVLEKEYLGMGEEVRLFEEELKAFLGTPHDVMCVNTGTAALHLAVLALGLAAGDEVLVPTLTFVATFQAVAATGARPVACDVHTDTLFIDLEDAARRITPHTKAILPVHYASDSSRIDDVYRFAAAHGLRVIEDAAHSFGSLRNGHKIGVEGDILCFSFDGIKNITSGEGGAVVSGDPEVIRRVKDARLLGVEKDTDKRYSGDRSWEFDVTSLGFRYHMSNIMAAIGRAQLPRMDMVAETRRGIAARYIKELADISGLRFLALAHDEIIPHICVVRVLGGCRDSLREFLAAHGVETGIHYKPNHLLTLFKTEYSLPVAEELYGQILSLPLHLDLDDKQQVYVISSIRDFFRS